MNSTNFSRNFDRLLKKKKLKPAEFARLSGILKQQISRYLKGQVPDQKTLLRMAPYLDAKVEDFFAEKDALPPGDPLPIERMRIEAIQLLLSINGGDLKIILARLRELQSPPGSTLGGSSAGGTSSG